MDNQDHQMPSVLDVQAARTSMVVMGVYALSVVLPYGLVWTHAVLRPEIIEIIKSNKSTVDLITTAVVMYFFGASVQRRKDQDTVSTLVKTNAAAQAALAPVAGAEGNAIPIAVGEEKTVVGTE